MAEGYNQILCAFINFTHFLLAKISLFWLFVIWPLYQLDIEIVFFHGKYMKYIRTDHLVCCSGESSGLIGQL